MRPPVTLGLSFAVIHHDKLIARAEELEAHK